MEKIMFLSKGWIFLRPAVKSSKKRYIYIYIHVLERTVRHNRKCEE